MDDLISRQMLIDALHTWFSDGFDEDKWWNSTHVLAAIEGLPSARQGYKWETCFECPLSHGCPKIKSCTNGQAIEYASQIPNDCPLSAQPETHWIPCCERLPEENGQYLITVRYKHVDEYEDVYAEHGDWCDGNWDMFCFGHCGEVESILAWMPLPEPYQGGDE